MADILGLASQAAQAYRSALATISENIANANTEGYSRRNIQLKQNPSPDSANVLSKSSGAGGGVSVGNVRRAYSSFLEASSRRATSSYHALSSQKKLLDQLERMVLRSETDMGKFVQGFFTAAQNLMNSPGSVPSRTVFLNSSETLVRQFGNQVGELKKSIASGMEDLKQNAKELTEYARRLFEINEKLRMPIKAGEQAPNFLLDERDRLLSKMSEYSNLSVKETSSGAVYVYLSDRAAGVPLVSPEKYYKMTARYSNEQVNYIMDPGGLNVVATDVSGGKFYGVAQYFAQAQNVIDKLNSLAQSFAENVNKLHAEGIDMKGNMGGQLFRTNKVNVESGYANIGAPYMTAKIVNDPLIKREEAYRLTYQEASNMWSLEIGTRDDEGNFIEDKKREPVLFHREYDYHGVRFQMGGEPKSGDSFIVSYEKNAALALSMAFDDPKLVATSGTHVVKNTDNNRGKGKLQLESRKIDTDKDSKNLPVLDKVLKDNVSPGASTRQNRTGLLARIPAGTRNFKIRSLNSYSGASFEMPAHQLRALGPRPALTMELDGVRHKFTLDFYGGFPTSALQLADKLNNNPDFKNAGFEVSIRGANLEITNKRSSNMANVMFSDTSRGRERVVAEGQLSLGQRNFNSTVTSELKTRDVPKINTFSIKVNGKLHTYDFAPVSTKRDLVYKMNNMDAQGRSVSDIHFQKFRNLGLRAEYDEVNDRIVVSPKIRHQSEDMSQVTSDKRQRTQFNADTVRLLLNGSDHTFNIGTHARSLSPDQLRDRLNDNPQFRRLGMTAEVKSGRLFVTRMVNLKLESPSFQERTSKIHTIPEYDLANVKSYTIRADGSTQTMNFKPISGQTPAIRLDNLRTQMNTEFQKLQMPIRAYISDDGRGITVRRSAGSSMVIETGFFSDANGQILSKSRSMGIDHGVNGESTVGRRGSDVHIFSRNGRHIAGPKPLTQEEQAEIFASAESKARYGMVASAKYVSTYLNKPRGQNYRDIDITRHQDLYKIDKQLTDEKRVKIIAFPGTNMRHVDVDTKRMYPGATYQMSITADAMKTPFNPEGVITVYLSDKETAGKSASDISHMFEQRFKAELRKERVSDRIQVLRDGDNVSFRNLTGKQIDVSMETTSRVRQSIELSEPAKEDYLIITTGKNTSREFVSSYDKGEPLKDFADNQLKIVFTGKKSFDVYDKNTDTSLASYDYVEGRAYKVLGISFSLNGKMESGDSFEINSNKDGAGDSTNLKQIVDLQKKSDILGPGSGTFQSIYNESRTRFASMIKTQAVSLEASKVMYEQALKQNDGVKGVSLDREANDLLRMQQAYSAAARVMQSSKELFDTLLRSV